MQWRSPIVQSRSKLWKQALNNNSSGILSKHEEEKVPSHKEGDSDVLIRPTSFLQSKPIQAPGADKNSASFNSQPRKRELSEFSFD